MYNWNGRFLSRLKVGPNSFFTLLKERARRLKNRHLHGRCVCAHEWAFLRKNIVGPVCLKPYMRIIEILVPHNVLRNVRKIFSPLSQSPAEIWQSENWEVPECGWERERERERHGQSFQMGLTTARLFMSSQESEGDRFCVELHLSRQHFISPSIQTHSFSFNSNSTSPIVSWQIIGQSWIVNWTVRFRRLLSHD